MTSSGVTRGLLLAPSSEIDRTYNKKGVDNYIFPIFPTLECSGPDPRHLPPHAVNIAFVVI